MGFLSALVLIPPSSLCVPLPLVASLHWTKFNALFSPLRSPRSPQTSTEPDAAASATTAYKKREEESKAAGITETPPPRGGDPPAPGKWEWTLNWDPVVYDDAGKVQAFVGSCPRSAADVDRLVDEAGISAILCLQCDVRARSSPTALCSLSRLSPILSSLVVPTLHLSLASQICHTAMDINWTEITKRAEERKVVVARVAVRDFDRLDQAAMLPEMVRPLLPSSRRCFSFLS